MPKRRSEPEREDALRAAYNTIGVAPNSPRSDVKRAYQRRLREVHTDTAEVQNDDRAKELNAAWTTLENERAWNHVLQESPAPSASASGATAETSSSGSRATGANGKRVFISGAEAFAAIQEVYESANRRASEQAFDGVGRIDDAARVLAVAKRYSMLLQIKQPELLNGIRAPRDLASRGSHGKFVEEGAKMLESTLLMSPQDARAASQLAFVDACLTQEGPLRDRKAFHELYEATTKPLIDHVEALSNGKSTEFTLGA